MQRNLIVGILIIVVFLIYFSVNNWRKKNTVENFQDTDGQSDSGVQLFNDTDAIVNDVITKLKEDESYHELVRKTAAEAAQVSLMHTQGLPSDIKDSFVQQLSLSDEFKQNLINSMSEPENIDAFKGPKGNRGAISDIDNDIIVSNGRSLCFGDTSEGSCLTRNDITGLSGKNNSPIFTALGLGTSDNLQQGSGANLIYLHPEGENTLNLSYSNSGLVNATPGILNVNTLKSNKIDSQELISQNGVFDNSLTVGTTISDGTFTTHGNAFFRKGSGTGQVEMDKTIINEQLNLPASMTEFNINTDVNIAQGKKLTVPNINADEIELGVKGIKFREGDNIAKIHYNHPHIHVDRNLNLKGGTIGFNNNKFNIGNNQGTNDTAFNVNGEVLINNTSLNETVPAGPAGTPGTSITGIDYASGTGTMTFNFNDGDSDPIQVSGIKGAPGQRGPSGPAGVAGVAGAPGVILTT